MGIKIELNELNENANGGTEMMQRGLAQRLPASLLDEFQIICSRVREVSTTKIPILWLHDLWNDREARHLQDQESRERFAALVFVSYWQQYGYKTALGVPYQDSCVIRNAIEPIPKHKKPIDGPIRFIYHTTPHRGLALLVPVFERLAEEFKDSIHLDVYSSFAAYGWPQHDEPYVALFNRCKAHPQITYHGYQPNDVVRKALQETHVFAYPCIWLETSCISVIEAMSAGCWVIAPTYGALPETCGHFMTTYAFTENHSAHARLFYEVTRNVIKQLLADKAKLNVNLGLQKDYFDTFYNWDDRAAQWKTFLESTLLRMKA